MEQEAQKIVDNSNKENKNGGESNSSNQTHTLSEVADFLEINESTLRNWEKRFSEFLSNYRNQYNHRVFTDKDINTLERIKGLMESGLFTQAGVKHMLSNKGGININSSSTQKQQVSALDEKYKEKLLLALNSLGSEMHALRREMRDDLKGSLKRDIEHLSLLLFPPEKPEEKKPWWKLW